MEVGNLNARAEQGESPLEVSERQKKFVRYLLSKPEGKILLCMHGRAMRIFLPTLLNQDFKKRWKITRITISRSINLPLTETVLSSSCLMTWNIFTRMNKIKVTAVRTSTPNHFFLG